MNPHNLSHRMATLADVPVIVALLSEPDELGQVREQPVGKLDQRYIDAFHRIERDPSQYLMVVESGAEIVGTCHLTVMPSITLLGSTRLQIEAVRVAQKYRGQNIGKWMIQAAIEYGKTQGARIIQLTSNKKRVRAKKFYEQLGFSVSHEGMKLYIT